MATLIQIKKAFSVYPKWSGVEANEKLAMEACGDRENVHIGNVIEGLGRVGKLAVSSDYTRAYQEFFEKHPEFRLEANMRILDDALIHYCEPVTFQNLEELLMTGNHRNVLHQLVITAAAQQTRDDAQRSKELAEHQAQETNRMVSEITTYMLGPDGKVKPEYTLQYKPKVNALRALPFADLTARYNEVMAARQARKAPIEDVRAVVSAEAKSRRKELYSIEPPEVTLINPNTSQPFADRRELVNFLNGLSRQETRSFFFHEGGRPKSGIQGAVTKILNGVK